MQQRSRCEVEVKLGRSMCRVICEIGLEWVLSTGFALPPSLPSTANFELDELSGVRQLRVRPLGGWRDNATIEL